MKHTTRSSAGALLVLGLAIAGCGGGDDALPADAIDADVQVLTDEEATEAAAAITEENVEETMRRLEADLEVDPESGG